MGSPCGHGGLTVGVFLVEQSAVLVCTLVYGEYSLTDAKDFTSPFNLFVYSELNGSAQGVGTQWPPRSTALRSMGKAMERQEPVCNGVTSHLTGAWGRRSGRTSDPQTKGERRSGVDGSEPALLCPEGSACPLERLTALQSPPWFCALGRGDLFICQKS